MAWEEGSAWPPAPSRPGRKKQRSRQHSERLQTIRYGLGMWAGLVAVHVAKKLIKAIPVVGTLASPVLELFPTILVGPAVGAAVVFALDEGDVHTAARKVNSAMSNVGKDLERTANTLHDEIKGLARSQDPNGQRLVPMLEDNVRAFERNVTPALEREYRNMQAELERFQRQRALNAQAQLQQAAAGRAGN